MHRLLFFFLAGMFVAIGASCSSPGVLDDDEPDTPEIIIDDTINDNDTAATDTTAADEDSVSAISVAEVQNLYVEGDVVPVAVCGYIVGTVKSSFATGCNFVAPFTVETNLLLADSREPASIGECMPVELRKGTSIRDSLNLVSNPNMLGVKVMIRGALQRYFKVAGIKNVYEFTVLD